MRLFLGLLTRWQFWVVTVILFIVYALVRYLTRFDRHPVRFSKGAPRSRFLGPEIIDEPESRPSEVGKGGN